jgi:prolyl oligopeptidase PreP (S9A serine peptidase family)
MKQGEVIMALPSARIETVYDTYFGTTIADPYRWLEDWRSDEAMAWLNAHAAHARSYLDALPHRTELMARISELSDATEGFQGLQIMDAYGKVRNGVPYPAVMLTTGLNDPRVVAWQATKTAARLMAATSSDKPVLLRVEFQGGHGMGATRSQEDTELADMLAFLLDQFGM